ncbi:MAG: hypothetical protein FWC50_15080 [Planctomycetaceae bacterium]|nr:hypothetical protein [Planctomycetaceae bacterium]
MLKNTWEQIRDLYYGMTPGIRIIAGLLAGVLVVSVVYLFASGMTGGGFTTRDTFLLNGYQFSPSEQRLAIEALGNEGLRDYTFEGFRLRVPARQEDKYIKALSKGGAIPSDPVAIMMNSSKNATPLDSKALMAERQIAALQLSISKDLRTMYALDDANVLISERRVTRDMQSQIVRSASVSVWPKTDDELDSRVKGGIAAIVKNAAGIDDITNITITNKRTGSTWEGNREWFQGSDGSYLDRQRQAEVNWEQKIRRLFRDVEGLSVTASISLEKYLTRQQFEVSHGRPTIGVSDTENSKVESKGVGQGLRPGYEAQGNMGGINVPLPLNNANAASGSSHTANFNRDRIANVMQGTEGTVTFVPLPPKSLSVSLRVPYSYFRRTWELAHPPADGEQQQEPQQNELDAWVTTQIAQMKEQIITLIKQENEGVEEASLDRFVTIVPYHETPPLPPRILSGSQSVMYWFSDNWKTVGLFGIIAVALGVLWGVTRPAKPEPIIIYEAAEMPHVEPERTKGSKGTAGAFDEEEEEMAVPRTLEPFNKSVRSLQEEISELVAENPDAAANVLRQWIGKVAVQEH